MGIIRNIVLKTAIKKALLDVTKEIELHEKAIPQSSSFGEMVMAYSEYHIMHYADLIMETWEATFFYIVARHAKGEMPSSDLIQNPKEMELFVSLIIQWVVPRGGNPMNITKIFSDERTIISCTNCSQKLRVPSNKNIKVTCKKCGHVFSGKF